MYIQKKSHGKFLDFFAGLSRYRLPVKLSGWYVYCIGCFFFVLVSKDYLKNSNKKVKIFFLFKKKKK